MTIAFPVTVPEWAANANYATGPDISTPTKVDPASVADGFIKGVIAAPQHVNFELNALTAGINQSVGAVRRALLLATCKLRRVALEGTAITDTAGSLGAVQRVAGAPIVAIKTAQALAVSDAGHFVVQGVPTTITSLVVDAATDGTRIVAIGTGGNHCTHSDDDGATWVGGTDPLQPQRIVWFGAISRFLVTANTGVSRSPNAHGWLNVSSLTEGAGGLAVCSVTGGRVFGLASAGTAPAFRGSADAATWTGTAGTVANAGTFDEKGSVAGNGGALIYHCGRRASGTILQISSSPDGDTWSTQAEITVPAGLVFSSRPRLLMCQNTGLLVAVAPSTGFQTALYASLDGSDWTGPLFVYDAPGVDGFAVAGGRLLMTRLDMLFASDGIGY